MSKLVTFTRPSGSEITIDVDVGNNLAAAKKLGWIEKKPAKKTTPKKKQVTYGNRWHGD